MTVSGAIERIPPIAEIELLPASAAQPYIQSLVKELEFLDGGPVYLVHDGETGTSDILIADLENALLDGDAMPALPAAQLLQACFRHAVSFRIWRANNDPRALINNTCQVSGLADALTAIQARHGATWQAPLANTPETRKP